MVKYRQHLISTFPISICYLWRCQNDKGKQKIEIIRNLYAKYTIYSSYLSNWCISTRQQWVYLKVVICLENHSNLRMKGNFSKEMVNIDDQRWHYISHSIRNKTLDFISEPYGYNREIIRIYRNFSFNNFPMQSNNGFHWIVGPIAFLKENREFVSRNQLWIIWLFGQSVDLLSDTCVISKIILLCN